MKFLYSDALLDLLVKHKVLTDKQRTFVSLEKGKQRQKQWQSAEQIMQRLKVAESRIAHVVGTDDPAILAEVVNDLQAGRIGN